MAMNDPLGDMLTRIRNAQLRRRPKVSTPGSKLRQRVLDVLAEEGYIRGYTTVEQKGNLPVFEIELKYFNGQPAIKEIKRISKPGRRVYSPVADLPTVANGLGVSIETPSTAFREDKHNVPPKWRRQMKGVHSAVERGRRARSQAERHGGVGTTFGHGQNGLDHRVVSPRANWMFD